MKINSLTGLPWKRLYKIGQPFWVSDQKWVGLGHLAALLALLYARAHLAKYTSEVAAQFMTAFEKRHEDIFYHHLLIYVALLVLAIPPLEVAYAATRTRLALIWRQWLSADMFRGYFTNRTYLWMIRNPSIDNPDQRMTQDPDSFANTSVGLFFAILDSVVNVIIFSIVLWHLSPILTGAVYGYAVLGCVAVY
jgi:putative ATP-binding cassette transporter